MRIYIMRHGQAEPFANKDSDRALSNDGRNEVQKMAQCLASDVGTVDCVLSSPFLRAKQTTELVLQYVDYHELVTCADISPYGDPQQVCEYISVLVSEKKLESLLIVSHLPLVSFMVEELVPGAGCPIFSTSAIACLEFDVETQRAELLAMKSP